MGSLSFQTKSIEPLVVTSLGFFKPIRLQDAARLLTTVVGLSELLRFRRLYVHSGLVVGGRGSYCRGDHLETEIKAGPGLQWEGETGRVSLGRGEGVHSPLAKKFAFGCSEQNTLASHLS